MLRLPAHAGGHIRFQRLKAMFAKMKYAKDFGHAAAYTAGKHIAKGMDRGVRRTGQTLNYVATKAGQGIQYIDQKAWNRINKNPKWSQAEKNRIYSGYKLLRNPVLTAGVVTAINTPISAGITYAGRKMHESGYTKAEIKKRRAPTFGGRVREALFDYGVHPKTEEFTMPKADKRYYVNPRIRDVARKRAHEIKRMRRI